MNLSNEGFDAITQRRTALLLIIIFFVSILLVARLTFLTTIQREEFDRKGLLSFSYSEKIIAERGKIFDSKGALLANNVPVWSLGIYLPSFDKDNKDSIKKLASILSISYDGLIKKINSSDNNFFYLAKDLDTKTKDEIENLNITGIQFDKNYKRVYPNDSLLSHVLGFTGSDNQGLVGIEYQYSDYLKGKDGLRNYSLTNNTPSIPRKTFEVIQPVSGSDVYLTIDATVQHIIEEELKKTVKKFEALNGSVIVLEVKTGKILGMANYPDYNLNNWKEYNSEFLYNKAISENFEPGSVFKVFTAACALENNLVDEDDKFTCNGSIKVFDKTIKCLRVHGTQNLNEMMRNSCNIAFVKLGQRIGEKKFYEYLEKFNFGKKTGIDLPGEEKGIVPSLREWSGTTLATMSFGQGIAVTQIQIATLYASIANKGEFVKPYIVDRIISSDGEIVYKNEPTILGNIMSEKTAEKTLNALEYVVNKRGVYEAVINGYRVAGKTGTAQIASKDGKYLEGQYIYSFTGILTVDNPEIVISVRINRTKKPSYSHTVAAPLFKDIAQRLIHHLRIKR